MKTIEERADAYVGHPEEIDEFSSATIKREAYIRGAKEQKAIDEEVRLKKSDSMTQAEYDREVAFADWYNKNGKGTPTYSDAIEWARKEVINKACELLKSVGVLTDDDSIKGLVEEEDEETNWKPSKEEMDVLYGLAYITNKYDEHKEEVIARLYQDLKREFFNGSSYENMFPNTENEVRRRSTIQVLEYARSLDNYNQYGKADIDKNIAWLEKLRLLGLYDYANNLKV